MKKLFQVIAVLAALTITACSGGNNGDSVSASSQNSSSSRSSVHKHVYVDDLTDPGNVASTCDTAGVRVTKCSCGDVKNEIIAALGHDYALKTAGVEEEGYTKTDLYECSRCQKQVLQWDALDFDASSTDVTVSGDYIKFNTCQFDGGDAGIPGTHIIYKIKTTATVAHANLSMNISPKTGYAVGIFDYVSNDTKQGYVDDGTGNLVVTTKRYGLKVNGVAITLGTDKYVGLEPTADVAWYDWAADFPLVAGDNTIDIFCLGGYRHNMYDFRMFL